jgi:hypothetical protein
VRRRHHLSSGRHGRRHRVCCCYAVRLREKTGEKEKRERKEERGRTAPAAGFLQRRRRPAWPPPL